MKVEMAGSVRSKNASSLGNLRAFVPLGIFIASLILYTSNAFSQSNCRFGPDTCKQGFVWREANPSGSDHVCVQPGVRQQARTDNASASSHRNPNGGPLGADTCLQGYVWRDAFPDDHVCVTPETRSAAASDNALANARKACVAQRID